MQRDKIIRRIGDSKGVIFNTEECNIYDLNVGDKVTINIQKMVEKIVEGDKE